MVGSQELVREEGKHGHVAGVFTTIPGTLMIQWSRSPADQKPFLLIILLLQRSLFHSFSDDPTATPILIDV